MPDPAGRDDEADAVVPDPRQPVVDALANEARDDGDADLGRGDRRGRGGRTEAAVLGREEAVVLVTESTCCLD